MGLRINTNIASLSAIRNLHINDRLQTRSLERLSSGLRINRGADDPSGLVISERLRAQIAALSQASENSQNAANLISTGDASLQKISDLLIEVQGSIEFALNTGGASPDQIAAEQDSVDQAVAAIDRIANTTRYGDRELLNGSSAYQLVSSVGQMDSDGTGTSFIAFQQVHFRAVNFANGSTQRTLTVEVNENPQRAELQLTGVTADVTGATVRLTGSRGTADVVLGASANATDIAAAINTVAAQTGVYAETDLTDVILRSEDFGSTELITLQGVQGALLLTDISQRLDDETLSVITPPSGGLDPGEIVSDLGKDAHVLFNGSEFVGKGMDFSISTPDVSFEFSLNADLWHHSEVGAFGDLAIVDATVNTADLIVGNTGLLFQLRDQPIVSDQLAMGIDSVLAANLGFEAVRDVVGELLAVGATRGGFLSSLRTGAGNDLTQNAGNALQIVNASQAQVARVRGFLGAVVAFNVEPNIDSIEVAVENLSASLSTLRDLDFAEETANFTRTQILFQSSVAALASARLIPQAVLQLLG